MTPIPSATVPTSVWASRVRFPRAARSFVAQVRRASFVAAGLSFALLFRLPMGATSPSYASHTAHPSPALHGSTNGRSQGYLGIEFHDAAEELTAGLKPRGAHGVEIVMVDHDGPAGKAGLRAHDLLVGLNGQPIASAEALRRLIHDAGAGGQVSLSVLRNGRPLTLNVQLAARDEVAREAMARLAASTLATSPASLTQPAPPASEGADTGFAERYPAEETPSVTPTTSNGGSLHAQGFIGSMLHSGPVTGAVLDAMEPQLASYFGAPQGTGLLVHSVVPGSPAAEAGLHAGDIVLRADFAVLRSPTDWTRHVHAAKGHAITLAVLRDRHELTLTLQPEPKHHSLVEWPTLFQ